MSQPTTQNQLRGTLPAKGPGARGIEHAARNPQCTRLTALLLAGIRPETAMSDIYQEPPQETLSPFAFAIGNQVERAFFKDNAAALQALYLGKIPSTNFRVVSIDSSRALQHTREILQQKLSQDPNAPHLIIKPRFVLSIANETYEVEPDALIAEGSFYRPIEIKSYADRGGKTDPAAIRGACRQLAVSVIALQEALAQLGVAQPSKMVPAVGDLILRAPGSMKPTRREMLLRGEVSSIRSYLRELPQMLSAMPSASLDTSGALDALPNNYRSNCREFCAMAHRCKQQALECGTLSAFGDNASESLAAAQNMGRVIELLQPGTAKTPEEETLSKQLQEAARALQQVL